MASVFQPVSLWHSVGVALVSNRFSERAALHEVGDDVNPYRTDVVHVDSHLPDSIAIARAAALIRSGEPVAFPTETVYGLGAAALDSAAVQRIFEAKGRPANNPIIVHVADASAARTLAADWPPIADALIERFWPGPLTLVFNKSAIVPDIVTAGGPTVAIRCPAHPVARALLVAAGIPIAAPSANHSTRVSPTTAAHVLAALDGRIALILDGGPCARGIESTVLSLATDPPMLLRPGPVSAHELESVLGTIAIAPHAGDSTSALPSPGRMERHYAPRAAAEIIPADQFAACSATIRSHAGPAARIGRIQLGDLPVARNASADPMIVILPVDAAGYSAGLYAALHRLDDLGATHILIDAVPDNHDWMAVRDRLRRASHQ